MNSAQKISILICFLLFVFSVDADAQKRIYVSPDGFDVNAGTIELPVYSFGKAVQLARILDEDIVEIIFREGTYYLDNCITITSKDFYEKRLIIKANGDEKVVLSGGKFLDLKWVKNKNGVYESLVDFTNFDQLFINGTKRILARYPNYIENEILNGYSEDAVSASRFRKWENPVGGYIHALHRGQWGGMHYIITGRTGDEIFYEGGFQNNRPSPMHTKYRFVENIFEELDDNGEWYLDKLEKKLYYIPFEDEDLSNNVSTEVSVLPQIIQLTGTPELPLKNVEIHNICFKHTRRTFMEDYEQLMRSDWSIYRGAAVFMENTEDCSVVGCEFTDLGGNAVFISKYGLNNEIKSNHFHNIGASAVCLVGDVNAVRSGSFQYDEFVDFADLDKTPGPANNLYPRQCVVEDNLIHNIGQVEKQVAGVQIQIAAQLNIRNNTIYKVPRAGINIGDGAFGGHIIEYNDVFSTVLETSDHGAFNSWGRDRFWHPNRKIMDSVTLHPEIILLDALYTTVIRNNRFQCAHGWDIDLDDGSSNYHIYNNLCLQGGIKLREGFKRTVENNVMINNSFHPHVWFEQSEDVFRRNIVMGPYFPIGLKGWGDYVDYNLFVSQEDLEKSRQNNTDLNSVSGDIDFTDVSSGNYTPVNDSLISLIGFENFPMENFGVYSFELKQKAKKPDFPEPFYSILKHSREIVSLLDGVLKTVEGLEDRSAYGLPDASGVVVLSVEENGILSSSGIQKGDVLRAVNDEHVADISELLKLTSKNRWKGSMDFTIIRDQKEQVINITIK